MATRKAESSTSPGPEEQTNVEGETEAHPAGGNDEDLPDDERRRQDHEGGAPRDNRQGTKGPYPGPRRGDG
jgi:hypothetical protein